MCGRQAAASDAYTTHRVSRGILTPAQNRGLSDTTAPFSRSILGGDFAVHRHFPKDPGPALVCSARTLRCCCVRLGPPP